MGENQLGSFFEVDKAILLSFLKASMGCALGYRGFDHVAMGEKRKTQLRPPFLENKEILPNVQ